jgi:hypothetical protein
MGIICDLIRSTGGVTQSYAVYISAADSFGSLAETVKKELGEIDICLNTVEISFVESFLENNKKIRGKTINVNLTDTYSGWRAAIKKIGF